MFSFTRIEFINLFEKKDILLVLPLILGEVHRLQTCLTKPVSNSLSRLYKASKAGQYSDKKCCFEAVNLYYIYYALLFVLLETFTMKQLFNIRIYNVQRCIQTKNGN